MESMSINDIFEILPHRYPMLLVDKIIEIEGSNKVRGIKNVTFNEPFFQGHYPGLPIMPGVLILESMAQTAAVLLLSNGEAKKNVPLIGSIEKAKFRRQVVPGDQLQIEAELLWMKASVGKIEAQATVDGDLAAKMIMTFKLQPREESL
jgi:3-hydroxyacyl-[acyl-carrier-protein] dehydratase